jgi:tetratricopeptide (TPR) repeat protein
MNSNLALRIKATRQCREEKIPFAVRLLGRLFLPLSISIFTATSAFANGLTTVQELYKVGRITEASRQLDQLLAQKPTDPALRFQKAVILQDQKKSAEAISIYQKLMQEYPHLPEPMNNLAVMYAEQGNIEKARAVLESAIRSKPNYGTAFQNLGDVYTRMASRAYSRALQIEDSDSSPRLHIIKQLYEDPLSSPGGNHTANDVSQGGRPAGIIPVAPIPSPVSRPPSAMAPAPTPAPPQVASRNPPVVNSAPSGAPAPPPLRQPPVAPPPMEPSRAVPAPTMPAAPSLSVNNEAKAVTDAVREWAQAWSEKDLNSYYAAYVPGFKGGDRSSADWQKGRRDRILSKKRINVNVSGFSVSIDQGVAQVTFKQIYAADQLKVSSQKTLEMVKQGNRWFIRQESTG